MPKFTVFIPAFKTQFLSDCISSVLGQTYSDFELIIINDKSPEPVSDIVAGFSDNRIRYYENSENIGGKSLVDNWNKGLSLAKGEYISLIGDDDLLSHEYLETFDATIQTHPDVDVFHSRSVIINHQSEPVHVTPSLPRLENVYDAIYARMWEYREQFIGDFVYKTEALKAKGGYYSLPLAWGSDDITSYVVGERNGIAHINSPVFQYRVNPFSISSSNNYSEKINAICLHYRWIKEFTEQCSHSDWRAVVCKKIFRSVHHKRNQRIVDTLAKAAKQKPLDTMRYVLNNRRSLQLTLKEILLIAERATKLSLK